MLGTVIHARLDTIRVRTGGNKRPLVDQMHLGARDSAQMLEYVLPWRLVCPGRPRGQLVRDLMPGPWNVMLGTPGWVEASGRHA